MSYQEAEKTAQRAVAIDAFLPNGVVILIYKSRTEAHETYTKIVEEFGGRELTAHVQFKTNETTDFSLISKNNADTIKLNNIPYYSKKSYVELTTLSDFAKTKFKGLDKISLWTAFSVPSGEYEFDHMKEFLTESKTMLNIIGFTSGFFEVE